MHTPENLSERIFGAAINALELYSVYLGQRLGLYDALRERGPLSPSQLAEHTGIALRYAAEWLEQQAVAGLLAVARDIDGGDERSFALPEAHVGALCEPDHPEHVAAVALAVVGVAGALPDVVHAYRDGTGVPYDRYGEDFCDGQAGLNRPLFVHELASRWFPAVPALHERLSAPGARIADVACGKGWSTIALARAYPHADVIGYDVDERSIAGARANADAARVRARFECVDAAAMASDGPFDAALIFEAVHDMSQPVDVLAALRAALAPGGILVLADGRAAEQFTAPGDPLERFLYGWSVSHCLPVSMTEQPSEAIGTAIRPERVRDLARRAGFATCDVLPIDHDLFRFYGLAG